MNESLSLMLKTSELLEADPRSLLDLHKESGISYYWLRKFKSGILSDPSVNKVQALYEFLSGTKLRV